MKHEEKRKSLYVATHEYTTLTKVGVAVNPSTRMGQLKSAAGAELKIYYESPLLDNFLKVETEVLYHFRDKRSHGEWINETPEVIIEYIKTLEPHFTSEEYTCLSCLFDNYTSEEVKEVNVYSLKGSVPAVKTLIKGEYNIYITDDYRFYVFIQQSKFIYHIAFNIYRTARKFASEYKERVVTLNEETGEFIENPKFRIKNE